MPLYAKILLKGELMALNTDELFKVEVAGTLLSTLFENTKEVSEFLTKLTEKLQNDTKVRVFKGDKVILEKTLSRNMEQVSSDDKSIQELLEDLENIVSVIVKKLK